MFYHTVIKQRLTLSPGSSDLHKSNANAEHYGPRTHYSSRERPSSHTDRARGQRRLHGPLCLTPLAYHRLCLDNTSRFLRNPPKTLPSAQSGNQKNISAYCIYANFPPGLLHFSGKLESKSEDSHTRDGVAEHLVRARYKTHCQEATSLQGLKTPLALQA